MQDRGGTGVSGDTAYLIEKSFDDFAGDIEGVTIHYAWSPLGTTPDWDQERISVFMPGDHTDGDDETASRHRVRRLRLPAQIMTPEGPSSHYLLHHYFEYWRDGHRHYSPHFTEDIVTGGGAA